MILHGDADAMIAGGAEAAVTPMSVGGFAAMRALSTRNDDPTHASRPFDKDRDGFVIGEGAGILILEELEFAKARGAKILAEVIGYGMSADAYHMTGIAPEGAGAQRSMRAALKDAGIQPEEVGYINAHATATPAGDGNESRAIEVVFGEHALSHKLKISGTKSMTGHLLGGAGGLEAGITVLALVNQQLPPTMNLENPDPECRLDYVPNKAIAHSFDIGLSNSFGFGGINATLIMRRWNGIKQGTRDRDQGIGNGLRRVGTGAFFMRWFSDDFALQIEPSASDGSAVRSAGANSCATKRGQAAAAIMAALSVESASVGKATRRPRRAASAVKRSRSSRLAATPPVTRMRVAPSDSARRRSSSSGRRRPRAESWR